MSAGLWRIALVVSGAEPVADVQKEVDASPGLQLALISAAYNPRPPARVRHPLSTFYAAHAITWALERLR
jgi:hypothetical protein